MFFLLAIPVVLFFHFLALSNKKKKALGFANFDAIAKITGVDFFSKNIIILVINIFMIAGIIFALSGLHLHTTAESSSFSYVIAIDSSQSMEADDLNPSRIEAAKDQAVEFIDSAPFGFKAGVVSFSGGTRIEQDLTDRKDELKNAVSKIQISSTGGTDIYEAVLTSVNLLKYEGSKAIILISDGQINVGNVDEAIDYANLNDAIVHTIGIGTESGGSTTYGFSKIDEDNLKGLAYNTGGNYTHVSSENDLQRSFSSIFKITRKKVSVDMMDYLLIFVLILLVLEFFLSNTKYINLP